MTRTARPAPTLVHASSVVVEGQGILLLGPSGSGKSDLAYRLIDRGARLVCDDYCDIVDTGSVLEILAKPAIAGKMEVRGVGIIDLPYVERAMLRLAILLNEAPDRLPEPGQTIAIAGYAVPAFKLAAFEASAPLKVETIVRLAVDAGRFPVRMQSSVPDRGAA